MKQEATEVPHARHGLYPRPLQAGERVNTSISPTAFRFNLKPGSSAQTVLSELRGRPSTCRAQPTSVLAFTYGIQLPESEVCPANG